jgi:VWFA-related protein
MERNRRFVQAALGLLAVICLLISAPVWAQTGTGNVEVRFEDVDPSNFPTVSTRVTVLDPEGMPISGLDASGFDVYEDGQQVPVSRVEPVVNPDVKIAIALVIDISGSMYEEIDEAKAQASTFVQGLGANDLVAVIAFRGRGGVDLSDPFPQIDPEREIDFTSDKTQVLALIDRIGVPDVQAGRTPLYDALFKAVRMTSRVSDADYRLVLAFTDGNEKCPDCGGSVIMKQQDPISEAEKHRIPVFTIGLGNDADEDYLKRVALRTAGTYQFTPTPDTLAEIYQGVADQLKQQYVITYQAKAPADGNDHKLDVKVTTSDGEGSNVTSVGYPCPEVPGVRLFYLKPSDVLGQEDTVEPLEDGLLIEAEFTVVPDISACNPIEKVELYLDGEQVFTAERKPFHLIHDFYDLRREAPGDHRLSVLAYDDAGNVSDEVGVTFAVEPIPGAVSTPGTGTPTPSVTGEASECAGVLIGSLCIPRWVLAVVGIVVILLILAAVLLLTRPRRGPEPVPYEPHFEESTAPETPIMAFGEDRTEPEMAAFPDTIVEAPPMGAPADVPDMPPPMPRPAAAYQPPPADATEILHREPKRLGWLIVEQGQRVGKEFRLQEGDTSIGRAGTNDIVLSDATVSRQHAKIRQEAEGYYLYDLAPTNPTMVNGKEIARHHLHEGDRVQIGNVVLVFKEMQTG